MSEHKADIPLRHAMILWHPIDWDDGKRNLPYATMVRHPCSRFDEGGGGYQCSDGACWGWWDGATIEDLLWLYMRLVIEEEEMPAKLLFEEFCKITEFWCAISGSRGRAFDPMSFAALGWRGMKDGTRITFGK